MKKNIRIAIVSLLSLSFQFLWSNEPDQKIEPISRGAIILVSGLQASGKSTICSQLREILKETYLYLPIDQYVQWMPKRLVDFNPATIKTQEEGITIVREEGEFPRCQLKVGKAVMPFISAFPSLIKLMADRGHNIIVDGVYCGSWLNWLVKEFEGYNVIFVGISCPLEVLESREKERGSFVGLARASYEEFSAQTIYDIQVDSSQHTAQECAQEIKQFVESKSEPKAFAFLLGRSEVVAK